MKFIKISGDTLLNVETISTIRFYERDVVRADIAPGKAVVELVADIITLNGSKHTISGKTAEELSRIIRTA